MPRSKKKLKQEWTDFKKELSNDLWGKPSSNMVMGTKKMLEIFVVQKHDTQEAARKALKEHREQFNEMMSDQRLDSSEQKKLNHLAAKWVKTQIHLLEKKSKLETRIHSLKNKSKPSQEKIDKCQKKINEMSDTFTQLDRLKSYAKNTNDSMRQFQLKARNAGAEFPFAGTSKKAKSVIKKYEKETERLKNLVNDGSMGYKLAKDNPKVNTEKAGKINQEITKLSEKSKHPNKDKIDNYLQKLKNKLEKKFGVSLTKEQQKSIWNNIQQSSLNNIKSSIAKLDKLLPAPATKNDSKISLMIQKTLDNKNEFQKQKTFEDLHSIMNSLQKLDKNHLAEVFGIPKDQIEKTNPKTILKSLEKEFHKLEKQMPKISEVEKAQKTAAAKAVPPKTQQQAAQAAGGPNSTAATPAPEENKVKPVKTPYKPLPDPPIAQKKLRLLEALFKEYMEKVTKAEKLAPNEKNYWDNDRTTMRTKMDNISTSVKNPGTDEDKIKIIDTALGKLQTLTTKLDEHITELEANKSKELDSTVNKQPSS